MCAFIVLSVKHASRTPRKIYGITIPNTNDSIICFDKHGDVIQILLDLTTPTLPTPNLARYLTGSKSTLTDICLSPDNAYLAISDKDEKIRITQFPQTNTITSMCFSHTEAVSSMKWISKDTIFQPNMSPQEKSRDHTDSHFYLLSSGLDGVLCLFDPDTGAVLAKHYFPPYLYYQENAGKSHSTSDSADVSQKTAGNPTPKPKQKQRKIKFEKQTVCHLFPYCLLVSFILLYISIYLYL